MRKFLLLAAVTSLTLLLGCGRSVIMETESEQYVQSELDKLAPVTLSVDMSSLSSQDSEVVKLLVEAAGQMDRIFLRQVYQKNIQIEKDLEKGNYEKYLELFKVMFGPWNRLDENHPFINAEPKPNGANFYPLDMSEAEFKEWVEAHPEEQQAFESNFTVIRRQNDGLTAIPYSQCYKEELDKAADLMRRAADLTRDESLAVFLRSRALSFETNDYYQSDMDWMDLNGDIEIVIGPYEVYEDNLFGYKAAFESFICLVDHKESDAFKELGSRMNELEQALPIPNSYKNFNRGAFSPIKVVDEIFTAGDTKAGVQTLAFNLPNDERVREAKGSKKVMLRNVMHAKFDKILLPISERVLRQDQVDRVSFDAYFRAILMHEVSHGLGPGRITIDGKETTVNRELKELYSTIEEAKADVLGIYTTQYLIDQGLLPRDLERTLYISNLGGMFRSIRFGLGEAHGGGVAIQLNYYMDKGAVGVDKDGRFFVNERRIKDAVRDLARELLVIEAKGDYREAKKLIDTFAVLRPPVQAALSNLKGIPIDIHPSYAVEKGMIN